MSPRYILGVLFLNVLIENRSIVATVTLSSKMKAMSRILLERTHESLKGPIEVGSSIGCCVRRKCKIGITVGSTATRVNSIIWACSLRQCNYSISTLGSGQDCIYRDI